MADITANYSLEAQGLDLEKSQLELNIKSQQFRIAQTQDEVTRINVNIAATKLAIAALTDKIQNLKSN